MPNLTQKITKRAVDMAVAETGRIFIWDSELKGFGVKVEKSGTKTYLVRYRAKRVGRSAPKRFVTIGRHGALTPDEARARAKVILGAAANGEDPADETRKARERLCLADIAKMFLDDHVKAKRKSSTARDYEALLRLYALPTLGKKAAEDITRAELARLHLSLAHVPFRANRLIAVLSSLFSFAGKHGLVADGFNPAQRIEKYREEGRERYLSSEELSRLGTAIIEAETVGIPWELDPEKPESKHTPKLPENRVTRIDEYTAAALRLLMLTGCRLREILHLEWSQVDAERGVLFLADSKTGKKTVVLSDLALEVLKGLTQRGKYVIATQDPNKPRSDLKKPWALICRRAQLEGVRLHDLRHTFASIAAGENLGLPIIGKLLGHSQPQTTARYAHLDAIPMRRATNVVGEQIGKSLGLSK